MHFGKSASYALAACALIGIFISCRLFIETGPHGPYHYLWTAFASDTQTLHALKSADGITWSDQPVRYKPINAGGYVRDPSVAYFASSSSFWIAHTNTTFDIPNYSFDIASSADASDFVGVRQVDMSSVVSGPQAQVWAPEWMHNPDGTPWLDDKRMPHIIVSASSQGMWGVGMKLYEVHPSDPDDFSRPWSVPVLITGTDVPDDIIDPYPIVSGSSITLWFKYDSNEKYVGYLKGSTASLTSSYSLVESGNWAGWGTRLEGESVLSMGGDAWRIYLDAEGHGYSYSDSFDGGRTWTKRAPVTTTCHCTIQHGTVIQLPAR